MAAEKRPSPLHLFLVPMTQLKKRDCSDGIIQDELNRSFFLTEMIYLILYKCDEDAFNYFYSRFIFL